MRGPAPKKTLREACAAVLANKDMRGVIIIAFESKTCFIESDANSAADMVRMDAITGRISAMLDDQPAEQPAPAPLYSRPDCIFHYCDDPDICRPADQCRHTR